MKIKQLIYLLPFLFSAVNAGAQLEIDAQIRPRYEFRSGYKQLRNSDSKAANFVSQRTRIRFAYQKEKLELKISFQDVHIWGDIGPKQIKEGLVGMHEGWAKLSFTNNLFLKVGRQEILYDNGRLLTQSDWNQIGFTHDGLQLGYLSDKWRIETIFAYNQNGDLFGTEYFPEFSTYKALNTIWISRKFDKLSVSLLNLSDVRQKNDSTNVDYLRNTVGPTIKYTSDKFDFDFRTYYQNGKLNSGKDVSAYYLNTDFTVKFHKKFKAIAGFEIKSGNDANDSASTTDKSFDILYGSRHKFNGLMDYFSIPGSTGGSGLVDIYGKARLDAGKKVLLMADWHYFSLQNNYLDANNNNVDKYLGNELDLSVKFKFSKSVQLYLAYCMMFGTETLELLKGGDKDLVSSFGVVMLTIKPALFKQKNNK